MPEYIKFFRRPVETQNLASLLWTNILAAAAGGMIAGVLLAFLETIGLLLLDSTALSIDVLLWSMMAYGLAGLLAGTLFGVIAALLLGRRLDPYSARLTILSGAAVFAGAGLIIARYRVVRDLFQERLPLSTPTGLMVHGVLLIVFGTLFLVVVLILYRRSRTKGQTLNVGSEDDSEDDNESDAADTDLKQAVSRRNFVTATLAAGLIGMPLVIAANQRFGRQRTSYAANQLDQVLRQQLQDRPNVILIVADTVRADHLGAYGYDSARTPHLDALAAGSTLFANAFAQAAWTKPSMATILTSMYPTSHNTLYKISALPDTMETLAGALSAQGYVTGGFANNINIAPFFNFQRGFADYEFLAPDYLLGATDASSQLTIYQTARLLNERFLATRKNVHNFYQPAEVVNERALQWLSARQDERFFLFLHYMDAHDPYFEHPFNGHGIARVSTPNPPADMAPDMRALYDSEITYVDQHVGELVDWLKRQGLYEKTMIIFTADHGEEFHEHGGWWHGLTLYDEQIHIPLLIKWPHQAEGAVESDLARSLDIAPTILQAAGIDVPGTMQGLDLRSMLRPIQYVYAEEDHQGNVLRAGRSLQWKFMEANVENPRGLPHRSLFDMHADPGEQHNLSQQESDKVAMATSRLDAMKGWAGEHAVAANQVALDQARLDALEKSGYGR